MPLPTSARTEELAAHYGIPLIPLHQAEQIHLAIDGVDAIDPDFYSIKGGGGALFREKVIASKARGLSGYGPKQAGPNAERTYAASGGGALCNGVCGGTGTGHGFYIQAAPERGWPGTGNNPDRDDSGASAFLTDNGNHILDLQGKEGVDYRLMAGRLKALTGVVETGIFGNICEKIIVGTEDGMIVKSSGNHSVPSPLIQISSCQK